MGKDNLFAEDITSLPEDTTGIDKVAKKRVNGNRKGKNFERSICDDLGKRFGGVFRRVPTSGAMVGGMNRFKYADINEAAKLTLAGDIICPPHYNFVTECKNYYDSPKISNILSIGDRDLDSWIDQAKIESEFVKKDWMIIFKITVLRGKTFIAVDYDKFTSLHQTLPITYIKYKSCIILDYDIFFDTLVAPYIEDYKKTRMST